MGESINLDTQNGRFIREHPIRMDDLGVSPFQETSMFQRVAVNPGSITRIDCGNLLPVNWGLFRFDN